MPQSINFPIFLVVSAYFSIKCAGTSKRGSIKAMAEEIKQKNFGEFEFENLEKPQLMTLSDFCCLSGLKPLTKC